MLDLHDIIRCLQALPCIRELFSLFGLEDVEVDIKSMNNANLIGTGIAALS